MGYLTWAGRFVIDLLRDRGADTTHPRGDRPEEWNQGYWEPIKIAVGALFALSLKSGFDAALVFFRDHPISTCGTLNPSALKADLLVALQLATLVTWASMAFFTNVRAYFKLPANPEKYRIRGFGCLVLLFALFYFFGATIGPVRREQIVLVAALLVADAILGAVGLRRALPKPRLRYRLTRRAGEFVVAILGLFVLPLGDYMVYLFAGLIAVQAVFLEGRGSASTDTKSPENQPVKSKIGHHRLS